MKTFDVLYYSKGGVITHKYSETWDKTDCYCPECGKKSVWAEEGEGDYYQGVCFLCIDCGHGFFLPSEQTGPQNEQRRENLRE